jgi:hypothetical protein
MSGKVSAASWQVNNDSLYAAPAVSARLIQGLLIDGRGMVKYADAGAKTWRFLDIWQVAGRVKSALTLSDHVVLRAGCLLVSMFSAPCAGARR